MERRSNKKLLTVQPSRNLHKLSTSTSTSRKPELNKTVVGNERSVANLQQKSSTTDSLQPVPKMGKPKIIPIRHTLTSKLRMEKANPLLTSTLPLGKSEPTPLKEANTPMRRSTFHPGMQMKTKLDFKNIVPSSEKRPTQKQSIALSEKKRIASSVSKENKPLISGSQQTDKVSKVGRSVVPSKSSEQLSVNKGRSVSSRKNLTLSVQNKSLSVPSRYVAANARSKPSLPVEIKQDTFKPVTSISVPKKPKNNLKNNSTAAESKQMTSNSRNQTPRPKRSVGRVVNKPLKSILRKSASAGDLRNRVEKGKDFEVCAGTPTPSLGTKSMNKSLKSVAFYSPLHNSTFSPVNIVNTPPPSVLRKRLEDWLIKRGKSSYSYRHLCCFGLPKSPSVLPLGDSQKDNTSCLNETITLESSDSTAIVPSIFEKDCGNDIENAVPNGSSTPERISEDCEQNKENTAYITHPEALFDLRKLIHSGYPRDQCEQWLGFISKSHPGVKDLPQYWECLAALEEARGEFASAVDCYGRAVVKGADARDIDERLDELWEKFSSLSVSAVEPKRTPMRKLALDKKQIFKSTVIKFALQQKAIKRSNRETGEPIPVINYIVTPVRRSSRRSQSVFRTTPTVKCVNTLDDLDQDIKETMEFHNNSLLNPGN